MANAKTYLDKMLEMQNKAADEALKKYQQQIDFSKQQALQTYNTAKTSTLQDYYKYINPYGVQAEAMGRSGLSNSGLSQTSLNQGWSNYQNRLGQATGAYQNALSQADLNMAGYVSDINAQKQNNSANYYENLYNNYSSSRGSGGGSSGSSSKSAINAGSNSNLGNMFATANKYMGIAKGLTNTPSKSNKNNLWWLNY